MISNYFKNQMLNCLKGNYLEQTDFQLSISDENGDTDILINYRYDTKYFFSATLSDVNNIDIQFTPGTVFKTEFEELHSIDELKDGLGAWVINIENEIQDGVLNRKFENYDEKIKMIEDMVEGIDREGFNDKFNSHELEELYNRLEEVENKLKEKIEEDIEKESEQKEMISLLQKDMEVLKLQTSSLTKRNWLLSWCVKMYSWGQKNPTLARLAGTLGISLVSKSLIENIPEEYMILLLPNINTEEETKNEND